MEPTGRQSKPATRHYAGWPRHGVYHDLGHDWHASRTSQDKKIRTHLQGLQALGLTVTIAADEQAA